MMELIERRVVASQKVGVCLYFSQIDLVILILIPVRRNDQPLVQMGKRELRTYQFYFVKKMVAVFGTFSPEKMVASLYWLIT